MNPREIIDELHKITSEMTAPDVPADAAMRRAWVATEGLKGQIARDAREGEDESGGKLPLTFGDFLGLIGRNRLKLTLEATSD